jgi:DNA-binding Lrp family transcriptional regulator
MASIDRPPNRDRWLEHGSWARLPATGFSDLDRALIAALQRDGRASFAQLAADLGTTERLVRTRVRTLLDSGAIAITTVSNPDVLGYRYVALIGVRTAGVALTAVADRLTELDGVDYVVTTMGRYDLFVEVFCRTLDEFRQLLEEQIKPTPGVAAAEAYLYLSLVYQEGAFELVREKAPDDGRVGGTVALDDVDVAIVGILNGDGRTPYRKVADEIGVSESQVRRRVARMFEARVMKVMAITIPMSLGYEVVALVGVAVTAGTGLEVLAREISEVTAVTYVAISSGRFDLWFEIVCRDQDDLLRLTEDEIRRRPGIARLESFVYLDLRHRPVPAPTGGADRGRRGVTTR